MPDAEIYLQVATPEHQTLLANLLELYLHDMSEIFPIRVDATGRYVYQRLPLYWSEPETHHPYVIRAGADIAGFALITRGSPASDNADDFDMTEFFILRSHRRGGVGRRAAFLVWDLFRGDWVVRVSELNRGALPFWEDAISAYTKGVYGVRHHFPGKASLFRVYTFDNTDRPRQMA